MKQMAKIGVIAVLMLVVQTVRAQIPAFPGAEGFGAYASGGRGGDVYTVTSLNNNGSGTLREALDTAPAGGRTIVFAVSGYIPVVSDTNFQVPANVTIAGQTAPGDGVGLKGGRMLINGDNTVMRHFRIRHGRNGTGGDCLNIASGVDTTMLDHISMMFSTDENFSFFGGYPDDFTMQYSSTSWGMERHNAGGLWDLQDGTCHHSLWAHHRTRNPKARPAGLLEWVNNVTFHWRNEAFIMGDSETPANWKANVQGCYYISIDDADDGSTVRSTSFNKATVSSAGIPNFSLYLANTLFDNNTNGIVDGVDLGYGIVSGSEFTPGDPVGANRYYKSATPFAGAPESVSIDDPLTAYKKVVSSVGPLRLDASASSLRDELDGLLIDTVTNQYSILVQKDGKVAGEDPNRPNNGEQLLADQYGISNNGFGTLNFSTAPVDTDGDGMPDYWENALGWNALVQNHNTAMPNSGGFLTGLSFFPASTPAGYTQLEEYLHFKAIPHASIAVNSVLEVDLRRYAAGFSDSPVFTFSNEINGTAVLQPDGYTVHFTPLADHAGRCRFDFTVTDAAGSTWTQTFGVLASYAFVAPAAPSGLGAIPASSYQIDLDWTDHANNETGFRIERSSDGTNFSEIDVVAADTTSYSNEGLAPGSTRYYRVRAFNASANSSYSSTASATTPDGAPAAPSGLSAEPGNSEVTLSWSASPGADSYIIKRALASGGPYAAIATTATAGYVDAGVANLIPYFYVVSAVNAFGESTNSGEVSATPQVDIKINAGGPAVSPYEADGYYAGGATYENVNSIDTSGVSDPAPDAVYTTEHNGDFMYTIPGLDPGKGYVLRLHFAEIYHTSSGSRTFNVLINGTQVLTAFDIYAETGARYKALVRQFTATADSAGEIEIEFDTVVDNAKVSGIEVLSAPESPATLLPVADTHVRYGVDQHKNYGTSATMDTRQNDTAPRDYMAYIRFDLSAISQPISNAMFQITKSGGATLVNDRVRVLGLDNVSGNTAQDWNETGLTWDTLGSEIDVSIYPSPTAGESPLAVGRVTDFEQGTAGITEAVTGGSIVDVSGSALASWLESRRQDDGLATLIVDFPVGASESSISYYSREAASGQPTLTVSFPTPVPDETAPTAPIGLVASANGNQVSLNWSSNSEPDLAGYRVYRGITSGGSYSLIASGVTENAYTDTILVNSRTYHYVVTAIDYSLNESSYSAEASATPDIPSEAVLSADADTHVRYGTNQDNNYGTSTTLDTRQNDTAPRDFMSYIRFDLSDIPDAITSASFQLTKSGGDALVNGRVRVWGLDNTSGNTAQNWSETGLTWNTLGSEADTSIYPSPTPGSSPLDLGRVTDFEEGTPGITESILSGYTVLELSGSALATWLDGRRLDGGTATLIVDFPAGTSDKSVFYHSREGASNQPKLSLTFDPSSPAAPIGLSATAGESAVSLNWSNNGESDLDSYTVYRSTTSGGGYIAIASGLETNAYTDDSVETNTTYYYVVTANDTSSNESDTSSEAMAVFQPVAPPELSILIQSGNLSLSWPINYTGWQLMSRTNLLTGDWELVPGSDTTNVFEDTTTMDRIFYQLVNP